MAFKWACLVACCLAAVSCAPPTHPRLQKRNLRLCGNMLVDALATVCSSTYYDPNAQFKKRNHYSYLPTGDPSYGMVDPSLTALMDPQAALDFLGINQLPPRSQRGVADECCQQSCSLSTLLSYCGTSSRK